MNARDELVRRRRRWRFRRDLVIAAANKQGVSERVLADVFDLSHSRIHAILDAFRRKYGEQ